MGLVPCPAFFLSMTFSIALFFCLGLVLLVAGADILVRGASAVARRLGISPLIVGLTIVAMGTSAPELAVSVFAGISGEAEIALGNVVGSNICNVLFILGLSALVAPLPVAAQLVRQDVPLMIGASLLAYALAANGVISRTEGGLLLAGLGFYLYFLYWNARKEKPSNQAEGEDGNAPTGRLGLDILRMVVGLIALVVGARWLVDSAVTFAASMGVSKLVTGLTVVAVGTSLPELATSLIAAIRGERDIAVGNVVGSNLFNLLGVLGLTGFVSSEGVIVASSVLRFDFPVMLAVALACLPICFSGFRISRWEGAVFLFYFVAYILYLLLNASQSAGLPRFGLTMLFFVIPLTALTFAVIGWRSVRSRSLPDAA